MMTNDLKIKYHEAQHHELERVESKHDHLPPKMAIAITGLLTIAESGTVFMLMLFKVGIFVAAINALLPVAFLGGIAYFYAQMFELPEKNKELIEQYDLTLEREAIGGAEMFQLIPDQYEYDGQKIDGYMNWMKTSDLYSSVQSEAMLKSKFDEKFFTQRSLEMDRECCQHLEIRHQRYRHDADRLAQESCPLSTQNLPPHQVQAQSERWYARKLEKLQSELEVDLGFINERHKIMKQHCHNAVETARRDFQVAQAAREKSYQEDSLAS
jgi:hypothetical protein